MITIIFNVVTLILCVLAVLESKEMWGKFANVIPALEIQHAVVQLRFISRLFGLHLFSLCFSGRKFLINLRRQFRVHNFFSPR